MPIVTSAEASSLNVTVDTGAQHPDQHANSNQEPVRARQRHKRVSDAPHTTRRQATQQPAPTLTETDIESSVTALLTTVDIHTVPAAHVDKTGGSVDWRQGIVGQEAVVKRSSTSTV